MPKAIAGSSVTKRPVQGQLPATTQPKAKASAPTLASDSAVLSAGMEKAATPASAGLPIQIPSLNPDEPMAHLSKSPNFFQRIGNGIWEGIAHVFTWIKQPFMPDLNPDRTILGYVVAPEEKPNVDGDMDIDVAPLPADRSVLNYKGRYRPAPMSLVKDDDPNMSARARSMAKDGAVHCEVKDNVRARLMPELKTLQKLAAEGKTPLVEISGRWTYDIFHSGWTEIHPVKNIKILTNDYDPNRPAPGGNVAPAPGSARVGG